MTDLTWGNWRAVFSIAVCMSKTRADHPFVNPGTSLNSRDNTPKASRLAESNWNWGFPNKLKSHCVFSTSDKPPTNNNFNASAISSDQREIERCIVISFSLASTTNSWICWVDDWAWVGDVWVDGTDCIAGAMTIPDDWAKELEILETSCWIISNFMFTPDRSHIIPVWVLIILPPVSDGYSRTTTALSRKKVYTYPPATNTIRMILVQKIVLRYDMIVIQYQKLKNLIQV